MSVTAQTPFPFPRALFSWEKNLKKLREGLILLGSLERFVFPKPLLFLLFTLQHSPKEFLPGERNYPVVTGCFHEVYPHPCQRFGCSKKQISRVLSGCQAREGVTLLIRRAVITGRSVLGRKGRGSGLPRAGLKNRN